MMFAAFFYAFLPRPARGHTKLVYMLLAFMWPLFSFVLARDGLCRRLGQLMGPNEAQLPHRSVDSCVHMDAGVPLWASAPGLVLPAPASVQQFNVFAPQYSLELHVNQVRLEVNELEAYAERRHRQHVATYEEAAALGLANVEERAERNHLETVSELQAALANSEFKAATREKALIAEMSLAQAHSVNEDNRLREELAELHQKRVSDALDLQLEESRLAQNLQEQANQHVQNSQEVMLEQFQAHFQVYKDRQREERSAIVSELREQRIVWIRRKGL
eukprot:s1057_g6.t1